MKESTARLIERAVNEPIKEIAPVVQAGEVNEVFIVTTNTHKVVARINTLSELERFKKEKWCMEQAAKINIPGPSVIKFDSLGDQACMVISFISGKRADSANIDSDSVWRSIGEYAHKIHAIHTSGFGENLTDIISGNLKKWQEYIQYNIVSLDGNDELLTRNILNIEMQQQLRACFKALADRTFRFGLSHGDLSLQNVMIDEAGVPSIIDWGAAEAHIVPHYDLGVILADSP